MHALCIYSIYKRETEMEAVIGVTEGSEAGRSSDGVLIMNSSLLSRPHMWRINVKQWKP